MGDTYRVTLTYPTVEKIDGLGTINTTRTEQFHYADYSQAWDKWKECCVRLANLGLWAQTDLIRDGKHVLQSKANTPTENLSHPLVAELEAKLRAKGQRP